MAPGRAAPAQHTPTAGPDRVPVDTTGDGAPEPPADPEPQRHVLLADLVDAPLGVDDLLARVIGPTVGGIGLFVGVVRDTDHGRAVRSLDYTAHPNAAAELHRCATEVAARHTVEVLAVRHRVGHLEIGDVAVVVVVGARHRGPALRACHELIDQLKAEVPVWKEQRFDDGSVEWVGL